MTKNGPVNRIGSAMPSWPVDSRTPVSSCSRSARLLFSSSCPPFGKHACNTRKGFDPSRISARSCTGAPRDRCPVRRAPPLDGDRYVGEGGRGRPGRYRNTRPRAFGVARAHHVVYDVADLSFRPHPGEREGVARRCAAARACCRVRRPAALAFDRRAVPTASATWPSRANMLLHSGHELVAGMSGIVRGRVDGSRNEHSSAPGSRAGSWGSSSPAPGDAAAHAIWISRGSVLRPTWVAPAGALAPPRPVLAEGIQSAAA